MMMSLSWDAELYLKFSGERTRPAMDLAARVEISDPKRIIDLGCGPGNSTAVLRQRWPKAGIVGLDSSPAMIASASETYPEQEWILEDIKAWNPGVPFDVIFSNAALQWVSDHENLIPRLFSQLTSGGALAVQIPAHFDSSLHREIIETARDPAWSRLMEPALNAMTKKPVSFYYDLLQPLACRLDIWKTEYFHIVENHRAMVDWFRGTGLRPYLSALEDDVQRKRFEDLLAGKYEQAYIPQEDGRILFPFGRLFVIAYRA